MEAVDDSNKLHLVVWFQSVPKGKVPLGLSFQIFTMVVGQMREFFWDSAPCSA